MSICQGVRIRVNIRYECRYIAVSALSITIPCVTCFLKQKIHEIAKFSCLWSTPWDRDTTNLYKKPIRRFWVKMKMGKNEGKRDPIFYHELSSN